MCDQMTPERHSEWLLEERVRARSGSAAVEEYLRGRAAAEKARADYFKAALKRVAAGALCPGWELRKLAESALREFKSEGVQE